MSSGKTDKEGFKHKMEKLLQKLEIDVEIFIASGPGKFRKPAPGIFYLLKEYLGLNCNENTIMVGDAAGRGANKLAKRKV